MTKKEVLNECIEIIKEFGYISIDGILDECDEDPKIFNYCIKKLNEMGLAIEG